MWVSAICPESRHLDVSTRRVHSTMMDCDDVSMPVRLQRQVEFLNASPKIGAVDIGVQVVSADLSPQFGFNLRQRQSLIDLDTLIGSGLVFSTIMAPLRISDCLIGVYEHMFIEQAKKENWLRDSSGIRTYDSQMCAEVLMLYRRHDQSIGHTGSGVLAAEASDVHSLMLRRLWSCSAGSDLGSLPSHAPWTDT